MVQSSRSKAYFSEDFKLSVLKYMYENNLSVYSTAKKYGFKASSCIFAWSKKYPVDSKLLSLSDEIITRVQSMQKKRKTFVKPTAPSTREEQLAQEVSNLRKALAYSELRNEALNEVLKIGREQYGIDLLKKVGAKQ
ncbi:hypothetical protein [uncultured Prevotella sp.]|uniref:hypothetical protein n=1 Tax=uncultured Prevotella sp. TaxID=159272 RepID=UPI0027E2238E|nr:hypothetical protein [uncultured Prevotella sp.]